MRGKNGFPHWGDYTYYDTAEEYSGPIVLIAEPLCFEALPTSLQEEFTFYSALNDDLAVLYLRNKRAGCVTGRKEQSTKKEPYTFC